MKLSPCMLIFEASERSRPALDVHDMVARLCETVVAPWRIITAQGKYTLTATSNWAIQWQGIGQEGVILLRVSTTKPSRLANSKL